MSSGSENFLYEQIAHHFARECTAQLFHTFATKDEIRVMQEGNLERLRVLEEKIAILEALWRNHDCHKESSSGSIQGKDAKLASDMRAVQRELSNLARSFQDYKTQRVDETYATHNLEDKINGVVRHLNAVIEETHERLDERRITFDQVQVDVAETVIDTSYLRSEKNGSATAVQTLTRRFDVMEEELNVFREAARFKTQALETGFETLRQEHRKFKRGVAQLIDTPDCVRPDAAHVEHDREAHISLPDDEDQRLGSQLDRQVRTPHWLAQDSRVEDKIELRDSRHRVNAQVDNNDDEAMDLDEEHGQTASIYWNRGMEDTEGFAVWLDDDGDLQTNLQDLDETWYDLQDIWATQKTKFDERAKKNGGQEQDWMSVDYDEYSTKCLWSIIFNRIHFWTKEDAGNFACRACANNQAICFGNCRGRWEALPLPSKVTSEVSGIAEMFVASRTRFTFSREARGLWPAG